MDVSANLAVKVVWYKKIDSLGYVQIQASLSVDERIVSRDLNP